MGGVECGAVGGLERRDWAHWARHLAVVAGSVLACALAALPFAGGVGEQTESVATVPGIASARPAELALPALGSTAPAQAVTESGFGSGIVLVPEGTEPPPPPPPPEGVEPSPSVGVVAGTGGLGPPVAVEPPASPPAEPRFDPNRPGERVWAVVIGIDDYPGTRSDLAAATADAGDLVTALFRFGVPSHQVNALYNGAATIDGVLAAVDWLVEHAGPEDTAVFLFAGHIRDLGRGTEAMVTADAGWITDWYLAERFEALRSRDAWFVMAGCYGGGFDELLGPSRVLTAAAGPGQLAFENDRYGRSYLGEFLLRRGLVDGAAGEPTVQAAVAYAVEQLRAKHPNRQLWHNDQAGHTISLDGIRRDGSAQPGGPPPTPTTAPPPQTPPDSGDLLADAACVLFLGSCTG